MQRAVAGLIGREDSMSFSINISPAAFARSEPTGCVAATVVNEQNRGRRRGCSNHRVAPAAADEAIADRAR